MDYRPFVTETLSIKVPKETKTRLQVLARGRKTTPSSLLREALEHVLSGARAESSRPSLFALSRDLFADLGKGGPIDLSSHPKHFEGFGK